MTTNEKRIKIAEACGITRCWYGASGRIRGLNAADEWVLVPNYFADLNAMHEAEKVHGIGIMGTALNDKFEINLAEVCFQEGKHRCMFHATAAQRAEAFGLTLNLWEAK